MDTPALDRVIARVREDWPTITLDRFEPDLPATPLGGTRNLWRDLAQCFVVAIEAEA